MRTAVGFVGVLRLPSFTIERGGALWAVDGGSIENVQNVQKLRLCFSNTSNVQHSVLLIRRKGVTSPEVENGIHA